MTWRSDHWAYTCICDAELVAAVSGEFRAAKRLGETPSFTPHAHLGVKIHAPSMPSGFTKAMISALPRILSGRSLRRRRAQVLQLELGQGELPASGNLWQQPEGWRSVGRPASLSVWRDDLMSLVARPGEAGLNPELSRGAAVRCPGQRVGACGRSTCGKRPVSRERSRGECLGTVRVYPSVTRRRSRRGQHGLSSTGSGGRGKETSFRRSEHLAASSLPGTALIGRSPARAR